MERRWFCEEMINRITLLLFIGLALNGCVKDKTDKNKTTQEQASTKPSGKDLVGHDWVYPNMETMLAAWKFMDDGTFNVSQKMFGGSTRYGQWKDLGNGEIELIYNDGGTVKGNKVKAIDTLTFNSKSNFKLGSTEYKRY